MLPKLALVSSIGRRADGLPPPFQCSWADGGLDAAWVYLAGELDIATTPWLERALREPTLPARLIVLDLRDLAFIDSSGVHAIVDASIRARQLGHRMLLLCGGPGVDRVFTLTASSEASATARSSRSSHPSGRSCGSSRKTSRHEGPLGRPRAEHGQQRSVRRRPRPTAVGREQCASTCATQAQRGV